MLTFEALRNAVDKQLKRNTKIAKRLDAIMDDARVNADDTVYVEKAAAPDDWNRIATETLRLSLSNSTNRAVIRWFEQRGIVA